jgi:hypothetical protein
LPNDFLKARVEASRREFLGQKYSITLNARDFSNEIARVPATLKSSRTEAETGGTPAS